MIDLEEWRIYDPADIRTHPVGQEGIANVIVEFEDGRVLPGTYGLGGFSPVGGRFVGHVPIARWKYQNQSAEDNEDRPPLL